jgi:N-acetylneuraminic acid mutarotase
MAPTIRSIRWKIVLITLATLAVGAASANHYILPCDDDCPSRWVAAADLNYSRSFHTATLLPDGTVLVAGGEGVLPTGTAERYDPATNTWSVAANLATPRAAHTATLLQNGKVLVVGGRGESSFLSSVELYDPASDAWRPAASMSVPRVYHTATLLPDGRVLVAGGGGGGGDDRAELYDPATDTWARAQNMAVARFGHVATLLPDGEVLVAGGYWQFPPRPPDAEIYNPLGNRWYSAGKLSAQLTRIGFFSSTLLPNGMVMVAGGDSFDDVLRDVSLYDLQSNHWTATASLEESHSYHTATLLPSGKVLIAGGASFSAFLTRTELYDPAEDSWSDASDLVTARGFHTATLLPDGSVLVVGGGNSDGVLASSEIYSLVATRSTNAAGPRRSGEGAVHDEPSRSFPR